MSNVMTVSQLAERAGTSGDTIRYYERIGLLPSARRTPAGYRQFSEADVDRVLFVKRAQRFGLHLDEIRQLLDIRERGLCPCGHARGLLTEKVAAIDEQLTALQSLREDIVNLIEDGTAGDADDIWLCGGGLVQIDTRRNHG